MWNRLQAIFRNIGVNKTIEYITIALSLISAFVSLFQRHIFFYLTSIFTFLSFIVLLYFLHCEKNKQHTLYMLAQDSRIRTLFLLLTYDYLRTSPPEIGRGFSHSKLQAKTATYKYKILKSEGNSNLYDLNCRFEFDLKQTKHQQEAFDVLILQPQGEITPNITYIIDKHEYRAKATRISLNDNDTPNFDGLLWAKLNLPEHINMLTVTFCLKQVDTVGKEAPIIICPFNYVDTLDRLDVFCDYSEISSEIRPDQMSMHMTPYDGSRGIAAKIADFNFSNERSHWNLSLSGRKSRAHAIYIVDTHHPTK